MTTRFYLIPVEENGRRRGPKYLSWRHDPDPPGLVLAQWNMMDYGLMPTALLAAAVTPEQHAFLAGQPDIFTVPENLNNQIENDLGRVQRELEALHLPMDWLTPATTYRAVLRVVAGCCQFAQRHHGQHNERLIPAGATLDTPLQALPNQHAAKLHAVSDSFGFARQPGQTQLRHLLKRFADSWAGQVFYIGGIEL